MTDNTEDLGIVKKGDYQECLCLGLTAFCCRSCARKAQAEQTQCHTASKQCLKQSLGSLSRSRASECLEATRNPLPAAHGLLCLSLDPNLSPAPEAPSVFPPATQLPSKSPLTPTTVPWVPPQHPARAPATFTHTPRWLGHLGGVHRIRW